MSTQKDEEIFVFGRRFREERERLGFTQRGLATRIATTERTIIAYETDATQPKLGKLILFYGAGADLLYILTGERQQVDLSKPSTHSERLAAAIADMELSEADAELLLAMARRLAKPG